MAGVDDAELENIVRRLQCQYPNSGNEVSLVGLTLKSVLKVHQVIHIYFLVFNTPILDDASLAGSRRIEGFTA